MQHAIMLIWALKLYIWSHNFSVCHSRQIYKDDDDFFPAQIPNAYSQNTDRHSSLFDRELSAIERDDGEEEEGFSFQERPPQFRTNYSSPATIPTKSKNYETDETIIMNL